MSLHTGSPIARLTWLHPRVASPLTVSVLGMVALALFPASARAQTYDFVVSNLTIDADDGSPAAGFNLDGLFSTGTESSGCLVPDRVSDLDPDQNQDRCASTDTWCHGGVDNVLPRLTTVIDDAFTGLRSPIRTVLASQLATGGIVLLVRLEGVDNLVNDPAVTVSVYHGYAADPSCNVLSSGLGHIFVANDSLTVSGDLEHPLWSAAGSIVNGRLQVRYGSSATLAAEAPVLFVLNQLLFRVTLDSSGRTATNGNAGAWIAGTTLRDLAILQYPVLRTVFNGVVPQLDDLPNLTTGACGGDYANPVGGAGIGLRFALTRAIIVGTRDSAPSGACGNPGGGPCSATTQSDPANCGWCGHVCGTNRYCSAGSCIVGSPSVPSRFNLAADDSGDLIAVDFSGTVWVAMNGFGDPTYWENVGQPPGDPILYGTVANQPAGEGTKMAFGVGKSGGLWELNYHPDANDGLGSYWNWFDRGISTNCGAIVDQPALAEVTGQFTSVVVRCQNNLLAELTAPGYQWIEHTPPVGLVLDRSPAVAAGIVNSSPHIGAAVFDRSGSVWAILGAPGYDNWSWVNQGTPSGTSLVGNPSFVYDTSSGYQGGLFVGSDGQAWELGLTSGPGWVPHGFPGRTNCQRPDGNGFSMAMDSANQSWFGVLRCTGLNADGVNSVARLTQAGGVWTWESVQVAPPLLSPSTGVYLWGDPFAVVYRGQATSAGAYEALFMAYDVATGQLVPDGWRGLLPYGSGWLSEGDNQIQPVSEVLGAVANTQFQQPLYNELSLLRTACWSTGTIAVPSWAPTAAYIANLVENTAGVTSDQSSAVSSLVAATNAVDFCSAAGRVFYTLQFPNPAPDPGVQVSQAFAGQLSTLQTACNAPGWPLANQSSLISAIVTGFNQMTSLTQDQHNAVSALATADNSPSMCRALDWVEFVMFSGNTGGGGGGGGSGGGGGGSGPPQAVIDALNAMSTACQNPATVDPSAQQTNVSVLVAYAATQSNVPAAVLAALGAMQAASTGTAFCSALSDLLAAIGGGH